MKKTTLFAIPLAALLLGGCASTQSTPSQADLAVGAGCGQLNSEATVAKIYAPGAIYSAKPFEEKVFRARAIQPTVVMGASLYVRAEQEMNAPFMRRALACHAASGQAAHPNDPLFPSNGNIASLEVREGKNGFVIDVVADEPKVGQEIWRRAESISQGGGSVKVEQVGAQSGSSATF